MNGLTRRERLVTDRDKILEILDKAKVMHLGLVDGDEPYIVPMNYGYTFEDDKLTIWLHGALRGRKYDLIRKNPKVCFEMECDLVPFEGDVACRYGISYSSLMGRGIAHIIEDVSEKQKALSILMKTQTDKHFEFNEKLASVVGIIRIDVIDYTAKHRPMPEK
ncbi:MAG: pyridoxamine 5'-phosphate oxidase family protein [Clostridia bacterium]|nr:pyridoxamine 5'-phosphate oxidase family protein [Clostridia bacterium]